MSECALCDLPTPDPPVTDSDVAGEYCCRGCLEVGRRLDDVAAADPDSVDAADVGDAAEAESSRAVPEDAETAYLDVDGLHCSACELFLEAETASERGVHDADVSYATDAARVSYDPEVVDPSDLPSVFDRLGYGASLPDGEESAAEGADGWLAADDLRVVVGSLLGMVVMLGYGLVLYGSYLDLAPTTELGVLAATLALGTVYCAVTFGLVFGLLEAVALLAVLQSVSFTAILNADALSVGAVVPVVAALASVVVFYTGRPFLRGAYVSLRAGRPNMDLLVALAVLAAWGYSVIAYAAGSAHVYFDVAVMVVLVVTLGNRIEERVKSRAVSGLSAFAAARVEEARRRTPDGAETVPVDVLESGDRVVVRAGERVPVDGTVVEGAAAVDESLVTGESVPDTKRPGDEVLGGTVVTDDALVVECEGGGSTADRLVDLLWDVRSSRPGVQQVADRLAAVFVPLVVALAVATAGYYRWSGAGVADAVLTGVAVLVVSCPCALGLATPLAVSAGVREALDAGVVVTDAGVFERVRDVDAVVLDKTGTLTTGEMAVEDVTTASADPETVLSRAAAVEQFSTHPVAEAVTARADPPADCEVTDFDRKPRGVAGTVDGDRVLVGHPGLFAEGDWTVPDGLRRATDSADGVPTIVGWSGEATGVLTVADQPRDEWLSVVDDLADGGREVVVLTGDDPEAAAPFREHDAVSDVFAGVPPEGKAQTVQAVGEDATVAMVGDGSNDAPALAAADLGVAMGSGTELAADAADAVVTTDLEAVPELFELADAARSRIRQNLGWAFTYNAVAIPLAVAALLNPLFAAVAMAASSLVVVGNSARPLRGGLLSGLLAVSE